MDKVFKTLGASNHSKGEREKHDYYATPPKAVRQLLELETFSNPILEPACGEGHIAKVLKGRRYEVVATDLIDRGYGEVKDLFSYTHWEGDIITNPPYGKALETTQHLLSIIPYGRKLALFLKLTFLETQKRRAFFEEHPPKRVYVASKRLKCGKGGDFYSGGSSAVAYAWFIWVKGFKGNPIIKWFN